MPILQELNLSQTALAKLMVIHPAEILAEILHFPLHNRLLTLVAGSFLLVVFRAAKHILSRMAFAIISVTFAMPIICES